MKLYFKNGIKEIELRVPTLNMRNVFKKEWKKATTGSKALKMLENYQSVFDAPEEERESRLQNMILTGGINLEEFASIKELQEDELIEVYIALAKEVVNIDQFTAEELKEFKSKDFWLNQDVEVIKETVDSFRKKFEFRIREN